MAIDYTKYVDSITGSDDKIYKIYPSKIADMSTEAANPYVGILPLLGDSDHELMDAADSKTRPVKLFEGSLAQNQSVSRNIKDYGMIIMAARVNNYAWEFFTYAKDEFKQGNTFAFYNYRNGNSTQTFYKGKLSLDSSEVLTITYSDSTDIDMIVWGMN